MDNRPLFIQVTVPIDPHNPSDYYSIMYIKVSNIRAFSPSPAFPNLTDVFMEDNYPKSLVTESPQEIATKIQEASNPTKLDKNVPDLSYTQLRNGCDAFITLWKAMERKELAAIYTNDGSILTTMPQVLNKLNMNIMKGFRP